MLNALIFYESSEVTASEVGSVRNDNPRTQTKNEGESYMYRCYKQLFCLLKRAILNMKFLKSSKSETVLSMENGQVSSPQPSFHSTISFVITLAQFFGVMPLYGMSDGDILHIQFKWKSLRFLYTIYNFTGALISSLFCCIRFVMQGLMLDKTGKCLFCIYRKY